MMIGLFLGCCGGLFLLSMICEALAEFIRHDLEEWCSRGEKTAYYTDIMENYESVAQGLEILRGIILFATPIIAWNLLGGISWGMAGANQERIFSWVGCLALYLVCTNGGSRPLGKIYATSLVFHGWYFFRFLSFWTAPLRWCERFLEILIFRLAGLPENVPEEDQLEEEIRSIVTEGHRDGFLENDAREMIERIMELDESIVSEIMTPRTEMVALSKSATREEMLQLVNESQLSRIPVFDQNRDDIVGILFSKDLLIDPHQDWTTTLHTPVFVPETKQVHILLREFLQTHNHLAIVLDEYGGVTGIVTLEDILEEIVGEITDETDKTPRKEIQVMADGTVEVLGKTHIDELNEKFGLDLPEDGDFETIGGFLLTQLGHVPVHGEELEYEGTQFIVLLATPRRVEQVKIVRSEPIPPPRNG